MGKTKPKKHKRIYYEDFEDEEPRFNCQISLGDVMVIGKPLKSCERVIKRLIKNKNIKNYLNSFERKRFLSKTPSYIE